MQTNKEGKFESLSCVGICNNELCEKIADYISEILKSSGIKDVIKNYLAEKLEEHGWNKRIFEECVKWLKANTASGQRVFYGQQIREEFREPEDVDPSELIEPLLNLGIQLVPACVRKEIEEQIVKVIKENSMDF